MKTVLQEIISDLRTRKPMELSTQQSIADWLEACYLEKEKDHLIGMCSIGSRNPDIDPEKVFEIKYVKNRILIRIKFLKRNKALCKKAFAEMKVDDEHPYGHSHTDWKLPFGRKMIDKARCDIGYSSCTANCDIFWSLLGLYQWLVKEKII
jgi:hypothetical protein